MNVTNQLKQIYVELQLFSWLRICFEALSLDTLPCSLDIELDIKKEKN